MNHIEIIVSLRSLRIIFYGILIFDACVPYTPSPEAVFSFSYDGKKYFIASKNVPLGGGDPYNILVSYEPNLKAVDYNQDETIDTVAEGALSKAEVQAIYSYGLAEAAKRGKLHKREWEFIYEYTEGGTHYAIKSYQPPNDLPYNEFIITISMWRIIKALDSNADGKIDYILEGNTFMAFDDIQKKYSYVLERGMQENKIEKSDGYYHVKPKYPKEQKEPPAKLYGVMFPSMDSVLLTPPNHLLHAQIFY